MAASGASLRRPVAAVPDLVLRPEPVEDVEGIVWWAVLRPGWLRTAKANAQSPAPCRMQKLWLASTSRCSKN